MKQYLQNIPGIRKVFSDKHALIVNGSALLMIVLILMLMSGCSKNEEASNNDNTANSESQDQDTQLTPEETFSATLVQGIIGEDDDPDLEAYLEDELYGEIKNSKAVTMDKVSSSMYIIEFENLGQAKSYLIRKFYNPQKDEYYFEKSPFEGDVKRQFLK